MVGYYIASREDGFLESNESITKQLFLHYRNRVNGYGINMNEDIKRIDDILETLD